jgi:hypothetical protein
MRRSRLHVYTLSNLRIAEKISGIVALLVVVMALMVAISIQSVRLQTEYRHGLRLQRLPRLTWDASTR